MKQLQTYYPGLNVDDADDGDEHDHEHDHKDDAIEVMRMSCWRVMQAGDTILSMDATRVANGFLYFGK